MKKTGKLQTVYVCYHQSSLSSVARYQPLQPEYVLAPYLSAVKASRAENSSADLDGVVMVFM